LWQSEKVSKNNDPAESRQETEQVILSNERTFLAWVRTGLALIVTGVALATFKVPIPTQWQTACAVAFIVLGIAAAAQAWLGWHANDRAARAGEALPAPGMRVYLAAGVAVIGIAVAVGLLVA